MKRLILALVATVIMLAALPKRTTLEQTQAAFFEGLSATQETLDALGQSVSQKDAVRSQKALQEAQLAFKEMEWLAEYLDPEFISLRINGAPIPKQDPQATKIEVLKPKGFQALEEALFGDSIPWPHADSLARGLKTDWKNWTAYIQTTKMTYRMCFEAARMELVRIMALGITGFDAPAQDNALAKSKTAFVPVLTFTRQAARESSQSSAYKKRIDEIEKQHHRLYKNADFETFNRLEYIRLVLNPAFRLLGELQSDLHVEFHDEVESLPTHFNHRSSTLFGSDLFDVASFTKMTPSRLTAQKIDLGKTLFFSDALSGKKGMNCGTCHQPEKAFTDGQPKSIALDGQRTVKRNAPTLVNAVLSTGFFYDLRAAKPEDQIDHVITSPLEFNSFYAEINARLQNSALQAAFDAAFPERAGKDIDRYTVNEALTAYLTSLVDYNTPVDRYLNGESVALTPDVERGFNLFMGKATCGTCHFAPSFSGLVPPLFDDSEAEILGVPTTSTPPYTLDPDWGRGGALMKLQSEIYRHAFKTVTVRNAALTVPYFHNGAYGTLEEVVEFYNVGGGQGLGLDVPYQTLPPDSLHLSEAEINDIVAFMQALTGNLAL